MQQLYFEIDAKRNTAWPPNHRPCKQHNRVRSTVLRTTPCMHVYLRCICNACILCMQGKWHKPGSWTAPSASPTGAYRRRSGTCMQTRQTRDQHAYKMQNGDTFVKAACIPASLLPYCTSSRRNSTSTPCGQCTIQQSYTNYTCDGHTMSITCSWMQPSRTN
jgi:hypothetical protein